MIYDIVFRGTEHIHKALSEGRNSPQYIVPTPCRRSWWASAVRAVLQILSGGSPPAATTWCSEMATAAPDTRPPRTSHRLCQDHLTAARHDVEQPSCFHPTQSPAPARPQAPAAYGGQHSSTCGMRSTTSSMQSITFPRSQMKNSPTPLLIKKNFFPL